MSEIEAIETKFKGYEFRSRTEARWAVFFESLEYDWQYEPQGFELEENGRYLPDFYLADVGLRSTGTSGLWVEVKGQISSPARSDADEILEEFVGVIEEPAALLVGPPRIPRGTSGFYEWSPPRRWDNYMRFMRCRNSHCLADKYEFLEGNYMTCERCGEVCHYEHEDIVSAIENAKSARFEHGEQPRTTLRRSGR